MKKEKSISNLLAQLEQQQGAKNLDQKGNSIQYWCGLGTIGGDYGSGGNPPALTGSQMTEQPDKYDHSDCPEIGFQP